MEQVFGFIGLVLIAIYAYKISKSSEKEQNAREEELKEFWQTYWADKDLQERYQAEKFERDKRITKIYKRRIHENTKT